MAKQYDLERLVDHAMVCERCGSTTTLAEILKTPRALACCPGMISKRKRILDQVAELHATVTGKGMYR